MGGVCWSACGLGRCRLGVSHSDQRVTAPNCRRLSPPASPAGQRDRQGEYRIRDRHTPGAWSFLSHAFDQRTDKSRTRPSVGAYFSATMGGGATLRWIAACLLSSVCLAEAHAFITGSQLAELCGAVRGPATSEIACASYISGAVDRAGWELLLKHRDVADSKAGEPAVMQDFRRRMLTLYCPPDGVQPRQTAAVVRKYLADNPASWHLPAAHLLVIALEDAFPC